MDTIQLTEQDIERFKQLLVQDEIAKLRADFESMFTQVVEYMNEIHNKVSASNGDPVVNYYMKGSLVLGSRVQVVNELNHGRIPDLRPPTAAGLSAEVHPLIVASGKANGNA